MFFTQLIHKTQEQQYIIYLNISSVVATFQQGLLSGTLRACIVSAQVV